MDVLSVLGISSLSVEGKLYGRVLVKRVRAGLGRDAWTKCLP